MRRPAFHQDISLILECVPSVQQIMSFMFHFAISFNQDS